MINLSGIVLTKCFTEKVSFRLNLIYTGKKEQQNQRANALALDPNTIDSSTIEQREVSLKNKVSGIRSREIEPQSLEVALIRQWDEIRSRRDKQRKRIEEHRREEDEIRTLEDAQRRRLDEIQTQKDINRKEADEVKRLKDEIRIQKVYFLKRGYSN